MAPFNWFNRQYTNPAAAPAEPEESTESTDSPEPTVAAQSTETDAPTAVNQDYLNWAKVAYENIRKQQQATGAQDAVPSEVAPAEEQPSELAPPVETRVEAIAATPDPEVATAAPVSAQPDEPQPDVEQSVALETSQPSATEVVTPEDAIPVEAEHPASDENLAIANDADTLAASPVLAEVAEAAPEVASDESSPAAAIASSPSEAAPPTDRTEADPESTPALTSLSTEPTAPATPALPFWAQAEAERLERLERLKAEAIEDEVEPEAPAPVAAVELDAIPDFVLDEAFVWSAEVLAGQGRRPDQVSMEEITWLKRLRQGLDKTRRNLVNQLRAIVGQGPLNQDAVMEIESLLLQADVGIEATDFIIESLQTRLREEVLPPQEAIAYLKRLLRDMLDQPLGDTHSLSFVPEKDKLNIWLMTGVNGAGKTTTIGKIAHIAQKSGYRCLIAAGDTFRAAAVQQVKVWGDRSSVEVIANPGKNTDPAAVVFDAIAAAQSRGTELLLIDTAGRLQNKKNLMDELSKIRRIIDKKAPGANVESLLVLDSTLGQNGLRQAEVFSEAAKLSGVVLTKLDGTARGGIALAVVKQLGLPIRFIGAGEGIEDLRPFSSYEFVEALLSG